MTLPTSNLKPQIDGYVDAVRNLPDEAFLGSLVFFSISGADVNLTHARANLIEAGLPLEGLRKNLRPVDAFIKAAKTLAVDAGERDGIRSEFLARSLGEDEVEVRRQIVLERAHVSLSGTRRRLNYLPVADVMFTRGVKKKGQYSGHGVSVMRRSTIGHELTDREEHILVNGTDPLRPTGLANFEKTYEHFLDFMDSHAVRTFVRTCIESLNGVQVKSSGGLYFIPQTNVELVTKLRDWVRSIGSEFHALPLLDLGEQRDMIIKAFEEEAYEELHRMAADVADILGQEDRTIESRTYEAYTKRGMEIATRVDDYAQMLGARATRADMEMGVFTSQLMALSSRIRASRKPVATQAAS